MVKLLRIISAVLIILISANTVCYGIDVSAKSSIILNSQTGEIIYEKNAYEKLPMASTTKIMTALLAIEYGGLDEIVSVSQLAASQEGSSAYLYEGESIKLIDLVYALMLASGNDAAVAISEHVAGSKEEFINLMNKRALELELKDTNFADPCGFYYKDHYSTSYDMAALTSYALKNPVFSEIAVTKKYRAGTYKDGRERWVFNHNKLLSAYDGATGVKTGYTIDSGRCLVSSAQRDEAKLVCVTLNCSNDWNEHKKMLDFGFSIMEKNLILDSAQKSFRVLVGGGDKDFVNVINAEAAYISTANFNKDDVSFSVNLPKMLFAPVDINKQIGEVIVLYKGVQANSVPLYADSSVSSVGIVEEKDFLKDFFEFIKGLFFK